MCKIVEWNLMHCSYLKRALDKKTNNCFSFHNKLESVRNTSCILSKNNEKENEKTKLSKKLDGFVNSNLARDKLGSENFIKENTQCIKIPCQVKGNFRIREIYEWPLSDQAKQSMMVFTRQEQVTFSSPKYLNEIGYIENFDGKGTSVLVIHANKDGSTGFYNGDLELHRLPNKDLLIIYKTIDEMVLGLKRDKNIDLTNKEGPLHFVACYMGNSEYAQQLAKIIKRTVVTYGNLEKVNTGEIDKLKLREGALDVRWSKLDYVKLKANYDTYL